MEMMNKENDILANTEDCTMNDRDMEFSFTDDNLRQAGAIIARYPAGKERSAIMPLLYLAQRQNDNWIPRSAMNYIANMISMQPMHVYEVASFYTMYNKKPVGKYLIQICRTTPCWLCNSDGVTNACKKELGIDIGETTGDGLFTLVEVECLGACVDAPIIQINDDYYDKLTEEGITEILKGLKHASSASAN